MSSNPSILGSSPLRKEGRAKVLGAARYIDDQELPGMWFGATVRSSISRGRIRRISFAPEVDWSEFAIVTASDIPGENTIVHLTKDHPCLASKFVNHPEEPILLLAHPDKAALIGATRAVHIEYDELPGVFTIEESEAAVATGDAQRIVWEGSEFGGTANCFKTYLMHSGDAAVTEDGLAKAFDEADFIVEGEYRTGAQEQLYIENNGVIAECFKDPLGHVTDVCVRGSMQCPFYLVHALQLVFNLPAEKCRVIQVETGGAFGGKEDFPSVIGSHAALLAMKCGHPVKDHVRPRGGHGRDHQAPPVAYAASHGRVQRRQAARRHDRLCHRRRRVCHAFAGCAVARRPSTHPAPTRWPHIARAPPRRWPPTCRHTGPSAASARRSPCSGWSATWTKSRKRHRHVAPEELRRRNFLGYRRL